MERVFYTLVLAAFLSASVPAALAVPSESGSSQIQEECGRWNVGFFWPDYIGYSKSISKGNSVNGGLKVSTDSLVLASTDRTHRAVKIDLSKYSARDGDLSSESNLRAVARAALTETGSCEAINMTKREIDDMPGIFAAGEGCSGEEMTYAAVYPVDYYLDKSSHALVSSALCTVTSTFDLKTTEQLLSSLHIERIY